MVVWQAGENTHDIFQNKTGDGTFWGVTGYFVNGGLVPVIVSTLISRDLSWSNPDLSITHAQAIYPMLIIVMVALKRAQADNTYVFSTHISFNQVPMAASPSTLVRSAGCDSGSGSGLSERELVDRRASTIASKDVEGPRSGKSEVLEPV